MRLIHHRFVQIILILLVASIFRLTNLGTIPSGLHSDEADQGYIAYSLLKTGHSPYGDNNIFAIREAWGGSRMPLYIYSAMPAIALFDLTIFAVRLPSAIYGILSVLLLYLILERIRISRVAAFLSAMLFAVNPWSIHISRQALLESIALFFVLAGFYFFLLASKRWVNLMLSVTCFVASIFSYDAPKIFLPPFIILLVFIYRHEFKTLQERLKIALFICLFVAGYLVMIFTSFVNLQSKDFGQVSIFNASKISDQVIYERNNTLAPEWLSRITHNKVTVSMEKFVASYFKSFSINYLFVNGYGNLQLSTSRVGQYHFFMFPLFFIGLAYILLGKVKKGFVYIWWMFFGALPGGLTDGNYPYRSVLMLPAITIISAHAMDKIIEYLASVSKKMRVVAISLISIVVFISVSRFIIIYFYDYPAYASEWWAKEQNQVIRQVITDRDKYPLIFIDGAWASSYAFFARTDPTIFKNEMNKISDFKGVQVKQLDNVIFGNFQDILHSDVSLDTFFPVGSQIVVEGKIRPLMRAERNFYNVNGDKIVFKQIHIQKQQ
ncbi:phospholipid carrier-dependent glycosyltransferase [Candidatus Woesebacteria bacterium]|jgi:4-amino-4-deoxy-L-arabinose transferase-like glycosyltransferase|nr:phospholipid carrier-dependent glycosyltransferase [Candidatus Woesebacteria bacterium]